MRSAGAPEKKILINSQKQIWQLRCGPRLYPSPTARAVLDDDTDSKRFKTQLT
jgi:hypothetical protein